jgi:LPS-assembly lipoprotein
MNALGSKLTLTLLIIISMIITGCGFKLRGAVDLPAGVEPIYIGGIDSSAQISIELRNILSAYGVELTTDPVAANYQLIVLDVSSDRRSATLGEGAKVAEFQLTETVTFELNNTKDQTVLGPRKISTRKIIPNDPNRVVSSVEESKIFKREMLQNLAGKIARQLRAFDFPVSQDPQKTKQTPPESQ